MTSVPLPLAVYEHLDRRDLAADRFSGAGAPHVCVLCGMAPSSVTVEQPPPDLLVRSGVLGGRMCVNRAACRRRQRIASRLRRHRS